MIINSKFLATFLRFPCEFINVEPKVFTASYCDDILTHVVSENNNVWVSYKVETKYQIMIDFQKSSFFWAINYADSVSNSLVFPWTESCMIDFFKHFAYRDYLWDDLHVPFYVVYLCILKVRLFTAHVYDLYRWVDCLKREKEKQE